MSRLSFTELKEKVLSLPYLPGVYLMKNNDGEIIYVGKAKKLKNRVSQYFQDSEKHTSKTRQMVSCIADFDYIIAGSEFEALVLECSLIKRHKPKYNILLKDDKGYPYIRLDVTQQYPTFEISANRMADGAKYFGPYGGRAVTQEAINTIRKLLKLHDCSLCLPRDIGKRRPCLNYQIGNCDGWCMKAMSREEYQNRIRQAILILDGRNKELLQLLRSEMDMAAENLRFEEAAKLRDRIRAVESLSNKQLVCSGSMADTDVFGFYHGTARIGISVMHFISGNLIDKEIEVFESQYSDSEEEIMSSFVKQYYIRREIAPRMVLIPFAFDDADLFAEYLKSIYGRKTEIKVPIRGNNVNLVRLANENAKEEAERVSTETERINKTLDAFAAQLQLQSIPNRIEAYDISNFGSTDIVASMTVFVNGRPLKRDYRRFRVKNLELPDDYESMRQVIERRFRRFLDSESGFEQRPDVLLIDGGAVHANTVRRQLNGMGLSIPVFGMVKDDRHRTRALITPEGNEIGIQSIPAVFAFVGTIQEETHRFAITYQREIRSKKTNYSILDGIPGVGKKRKQLLIKEFHSIKAIKAADIETLMRVIPKNSAKNVYDYFHSDESDEDEKEK